MTVKEFYDQIGSDYNAALSRLMDDNFIKKLLGKFQKDQNYASLVTSMSSGDFKAAFTAAHTLKGITLNLSMDKLGGAASALTEALRAGDYEKAKTLYPPVVEEFKKVEAALKQLD